VESLSPSARLATSRTPLIGRERELVVLRDLLLHADERLLTLTGVGGCGKTRLAVALASDLLPVFPQRIWFVELAPIADAALVPLAVANALGLRDAAGSTSLTALTTFLAPKPALLMLDNCEHLIESCAFLVDHLLATCPTLRILTTSRAPLQIAGERLYRVSPLALPDADGVASVDEISRSPAVQLFVARAQAVAPDFHLTAACAPLLAHICVRLDGIPLALELAAPWVRMLALEQILVLLDDSVRLLVCGSRVAPTRQQTLRAALDWSDTLLTDTERVLFYRLAVFAGEFLLEAVEAICADAALPSTDILSVLARLVDTSLVTVTHRAGSAWYRLLEPVRQYALHGLQARGEAAVSRARHGVFYLALAERASSALRGPRQDRWLERLEREQGNLRAALSWAEETGDGESRLRLATALAPFWDAHGHLAEGRRWLSTALAAAPNTVAPPLLMRALVGAGRLAHMHAASDDAERLHTESLALARQVGDAHGIATALSELGMVARRRRDFARSVQLIEESLERYRELGDEAGNTWALLNLGTTFTNAGDADRAVPLLTESLTRMEALGDLRYVAIAQTLLAAALISRGDWGEATQSLAASLAGHAHLGDPWFVSLNLLILVRFLMELGRWAAAARMLGAAQAIGERVSNVHDDTYNYEGLRASIRAHLRAERFTAAWTGGYALTFEQAVAAALAVTSSAAPDADAVPERPTDPEPLTRREREIARLIADGRSDRQIAETLSISVGTVGVHVHHILQKLGLYSRQQVADRLAEEAPSRPVRD
jgi:non-specific serine/threonine protein kinase